MINSFDILETIKMIEEEHLDIRTVTMGISLRDCCGSDIKTVADKIYDKVTKTAENLVSTAEQISCEYGIPIVNKRVSVTPVSLLADGCADSDVTLLARALDRAAETLGINFIGGYGALVHKGITKGDAAIINSLPEALATTERVCSFVNVATTRAGINMDAVKTLGELVCKAAYLTRERDSIGCAKFVAFANATEDNPFMAGAFHGIGEGDAVINVGVSGPGVVHKAIIRAGDCNLTDLAEVVKRTAFKITRAGQLVAKTAAERLNIPFGIVDLSLAPTPAIGDSVAHILEEMGLSSVGSHGTTAALALLNDAVKKGGVMASPHVGGLSGAFIPVSEDAGMITAASKGLLSFDKLEAMTAVCSVGLDMIAIPGDTPPEVVSAIIADEISIGVVNNKTTAVRVIPAYGKGVGDSVNYGGLLGEAPIMKISTCSPARFISRGGRIPAPIHSQKN